MELNICVCAWLQYVLFYQLVAFSPWIVSKCFILHIQGGTWLSGLVLVPYDGICPGLLSEAAEHILDAILGLLKEIPLYSLQTWHSTGVWSWGVPRDAALEQFGQEQGKTGRKSLFPFPLFSFFLMLLSWQILKGLPLASGSKKWSWQSLCSSSVKQQIKGWINK